MKVRIVFLFVLLVILAIVLYQEFRPYLQREREPEATVVIDQPAGEAGANTSRRLADGSFNPNPAYHPPLEKSPIDLAMADWRERYKPLLQSTRDSDGPRIFVYPFLDRTTDGIGLTFTYGWRLAAQAALEHWTNARVIAHPRPSNYGLPTFEDNVKSEILSVDEWRKRALGDSAASQADYILTGWYDQQPGSAAYQHQIVLLPGKKSLPGGKLVLLKENKKKIPWFGRLATNQRAAMNQLAEKLIEQKIVAPRPKAQPQQLDLSKELDQVALMLDTNDSWTVMEGIDRSLQLAALFPEDTLPLQAAAYGTNALYYFNFFYDEKQTYRYEYALRSFALSQLALSMDPKPSLSQMNWLFALTCMDHNAYYYLDCITGEDVSQKQPELQLYRSAALNIHAVEPAPQLTQASPHWLVLAQDDRKTWFIGKSNQRPYFDRSVPYYKEHDFFTRCKIRTNLHGNYRIEREDESPWQIHWDSASVALQGNLGNELAALLYYDPSEPLRQDIQRILGVEPAELNKLSQKKDFYTLRSLLHAPLAKQDVRDYDNPFHGIYTLMKDATKALDELRDAPESMDAESGYNEFEWSPFERALLYRRNDSYTFAIIFNWYANHYGVEEAALACGENALSVRGDLIRPHYDLLYYYWKKPQLPGSADRIRKEEIEQVQVFPLSLSRYYYIAQDAFKAGFYDIAGPALETYRRGSPYEVDKDLSIARLLSSQGCYEQALEYYDKYLKIAPRRYDVAMSRDTLLDYYGRKTDAEMRELFEKAIAELPGNTSFHERYIKYLRDDAKDYNASKQALQRYETLCPDAIKPLRWVRLEWSFGNNDKALDYLKQHKIQAEDNITLENEYALLGDWALTLDNMQLCEEFIKKGEANPAGAGYLMLMKAKLAYRKKQYAETLTHAIESIDRYGLTDDTLYYKAMALHGLGRDEECLWLIDQETLNKKVMEISTSYFGVAMEVYAAMNQLERADKLWEMALRDQRNHRYMERLWSEYGKINPIRAELDCGLVDYILSGKRRII